MTPLTKLSQNCTYITITMYITTTEFHYNKHRKNCNPSSHVQRNMIRRICIEYVKCGSETMTTCLTLSYIHRQNVSIDGITRME